VTSETETSSSADVLQDLDSGWFIYTIKQIELGLRIPTEEVAEQAGLTTAQFTALAVLESWPGITSSELARRSFVRAQTMAENVSVLLESGFIQRERDPENMRRFHLYITDTGHDTLSSGRSAMDDLEAKLLVALTPRDREEFAKHLRNVRRALRDLPR